MRALHYKTLKHKRNKTNTIKDTNKIIFEGNCSDIPEQLEYLSSLVKQNNIVNILEVGFNAGHSSTLFLESNPNSKVISFDICEHPYVDKAKNDIDILYPNRHTLIRGDSRLTIPNFITDITFDLIFIDGGHSEEVAMADLLNCKRLATKDTIIVLDDYAKDGESYTIGPTKAWDTFINNKEIEKLDEIIYIPKKRGMVVGKFLYF